MRMIPIVSELLHCFALLCFAFLWRSLSVLVRMRDTMFDRLETLDSDANGTLTHTFHTYRRHIRNLFSLLTLR